MAAPAAAIIADLDRRLDDAGREVKAVQRRARVAVQQIARIRERLTDLEEVIEENEHSRSTAEDQ